jgi:hypothetical protein
MVCVVNAVHDAQVHGGSGEWGMDMIHLTEEIVPKQAVETTDVLNLRKGAVNNMVDVRACNKPGKRVSSVRLAKIVKSWVLMESRRVLLGCRDFGDVRCVFIGLR